MDLLTEQVKSWVLVCWEGSIYGLGCMHLLCGYYIASGVNCYRLLCCMKLEDTTYIMDVFFFFRIPPSFNMLKIQAGEQEKLEIYIYTMPGHGP